MNCPKVVTIAGSDSGGGAGIQADIKAISANGCYAASVITALTAQNTVGVHAIHAVPVDFVRAQMDAVLEDIGADAVKVGMLYSPELIETVVDGLVAHGVKQLVVDPVMVATSGDPLLDGEAVAALKERLLPLATVITPNLPEAGVLLGREIGNDETACGEAVQELTRCGAEWVLLKGGHAEGAEAIDLLVSRDEGEGPSFSIYQSKRVDTPNTHGTGCTLSSAIAAGLAKGLTVPKAVAAAKGYISDAIVAGAKRKIGGGHGPVDHFFILEKLNELMEKEEKRQ